MIRITQSPLGTDARRLKMVRMYKTRKPSNADIRAMMCKPITFDELFNDKPKKPEKPLPTLPKEISFSFIGGKKYVITDSPIKILDEVKMLVYLKKDGKHHMFRNYLGGWITCYTDQQLIGKTIKEV